MENKQAQYSMIGNIEALKEEERYVFALIMAAQAGHKCSKELNVALEQWRTQLDK